MAIDYAHVPVVPPPPGVTSNFVNPESRAKYYVAIIATCLPLMLPIVVMRLYLRLWNSRSFAVDDGQLPHAISGFFTNSSQLLVFLQRYKSSWHICCQGCLT